eukprot:g1398.t1
MELLQKIKDASNGPEQAKRKIEELDKMIHRLKYRRRICGEQMEADTERMKWMDHEIGIVNKQRKTTFDAYQERKDKRDHLERTIAVLSKQLNDISQLTATRAKIVTLTKAKYQSKEASQTLRVQRGYSTDKDSKPYKEKVPGNKYRR